MESLWVQIKCKDNYRKHISLGGRRGWMQDRIEECRENGCNYPLAWSISPHLLYLAPDWLHWYYQQANETGQDVFVLPPSGHLYAYPGKNQGQNIKILAK